MATIARPILAEMNRQMALTRHGEVQSAPTHKCSSKPLCRRRHGIPRTPLRFPDLVRQSLTSELRGHSPVLKRLCNTYARALSLTSAIRTPSGLIMAGLSRQCQCGCYVGVGVATVSCACVSRVTARDACVNLFTCALFLQGGHDCQVASQRIRPLLEDRVWIRTATAC